MKRYKEPSSVLYVADYRKEFLKMVGLDTNDYLKWRNKWKTLRQSAIKNGRASFLEFNQYINLAVKAGLTSPSQIGRSRGQFQMARRGDAGDYYLGNCRFITMEQNQHERFLNGGCAIAVEKAAKIRRGQTKENNRSIRRMARKLENRTAETHPYLKEAGIKRGRSYIIKSPTGKIYLGKGLNSFCKEHNLSQPSMQQLCSGKFKQLKGWTGRYAD